MEEDADYEIEELKDKYEVKLMAEREQHLRLKGENGIMRKKFHAQVLPFSNVSGWKKVLCLDAFRILCHGCRAAR